MYTKMPPLTSVSYMSTHRFNMFGSKNPMTRDFDKVSSDKR